MVAIAFLGDDTTTTSLAGWLLTQGNLDPTVLVGGVARNFGEDGSSYRIGHGRDFVIEGDEYDSAFFDKTAKFLKYLPDVAVIGNVEFDHADIYRDLDHVKEAFRTLVAKLPSDGALVAAAAPAASNPAPPSHRPIKTLSPTTAVARSSAPPTTSSPPPSMRRPIATTRLAIALVAQASRLCPPTSVTSSTNTPRLMERARLTTQTAT